MIALNGTGWPQEAVKTHKNHEAYAKKTLYAYMPCANFQGTAYIDNVVAIYWNGDWTAALETFVSDPLNLWCPPWIRRNYEVLNPDTFTINTTTLRKATRNRQSPKAVSKQASPYPHADKYNLKWNFHKCAEPDYGQQSEPSDDENPRKQLKINDNKWQEETSEQKHSRMGSNPNLERIICHLFPKMTNSLIQTAMIGLHVNVLLLSRIQNHFGNVFVHLMTVTLTFVDFALLFEEWSY